MGEEVKKKLTPTIDAQHLMVGVIFGRGKFEVTWKKKNNPNHQVLWTAPDGWAYSL